MGGAVCRLIGVIGAFIDEAKLGRQSDGGLVFAVGADFDANRFAWFFLDLEVLVGDDRVFEFASEKCIDEKRSRFVGVSLVPILFIKIVMEISGPQRAEVMLVFTVE